MMSSNSPVSVRDFYKDSVVFITGATGYVGNALVEKLLRSCQVRRIYVLIRNKKGKSAEKRLSEMFSSVFFDKMRNQNSDYRDLIKVINGDVQEENLGISNSDWNVLTKEVNIVFHSAATVRFDENLKIAAKMNILATKNVLDLCKQCEHLKSVVYVSTAFSNCNRKEIKETFYPPTMDPMEFLEFTKSKSEAELRELEPKLLVDFPNTYTFTKCMAEELIQREQKNLPVCVVRPSIVLGPWIEPLPGYAASLNGPFGLMVAMGYGLLRIICTNTALKADHVPLDMVTNALLVAADTSRFHKNSDRVYNLVSSPRNPLTWGEYFMWNMNFAPAYACAVSYWCYFLIILKNKCLVAIAQFFLHIIPGFFIDCGLKLSGKKPMVLKVYEKIHRNTNLISYFTLNEWKFHDDNTQALYATLDDAEKKVFNFNIEDVEWDVLMMFTVRMTRVHLMNDPISTSVQSCKKYRRYKQISLACFAVFVIILQNLFNKMLSELY